MKTVELKTLTRTQKLAIILSSVLVFLIIASVVLSIVYANLTADDGEREQLDIREELGESTYANMAIAYERVTEAGIISMLVKNEKGTFDLTRWPDDNGAFWLGYDKGDGDVTEMIQYIPPIVSAEGDFNYESLYAIDDSDDFGRTMLFHLCSAVGTLYFQERIDLPVVLDTDSEQVKAEKLARRNELLNEYGLGDNKVNRVSFSYVERDETGKIITEKVDGAYPIHHIDIGDRALNGMGFYYRVDARDCIYYTGYDTLEYALKGFNSYIKGTLIAEGLPQDSMFEPIYISDFKEWKNTMVESGNVSDGSGVVAKGNALIPIKESASYKPADYPTGYMTKADEDLMFDLGELKDNPDYERIKAALVGMPVGDYSADPIRLTLLTELLSSEEMIINFGEASSLTYGYEITAIESVLDFVDASGKTLEKADTGTPVGTSSLIRVTYNLTVGAERKNTVPMHAVIDLESDLIPDAACAALSASAVGELASPIAFDIVYTPDNALKSSGSVVVVAIDAIYDPEGKSINKVTDSSYVSIRYKQVTDGKDGKVSRLTAKMSDLKNDSRWSGVAAEMIGMSTSEDLSLTVYTTEVYFEALCAFTSYEITEIECFIESEMIVSFNFVNESKRDPFVGESLYENTMTGSKGNYVLNVDNCQTVLRILGGLGEDTSSSKGMYGTTVEVGLDHSVMKKYGLYDYTVYFELPRNIKAVPKDEDDESEAEDFYWLDELGFTLYVSRENLATGTRYVGCDMYDVVVEIAADAFEFLDYSFAEFWARRNLLLMQVEDIESFEVDFNMEDLKGGYNFEITKKTVYGGIIKDGPNQGFWGYFDSPDNLLNPAPQDKFTVYVTQDEGTTAVTEMSKVLESDPMLGGRVSLAYVYNLVRNNGDPLLLPNSPEAVGDSNFMLAFQLIQMTRYQGTLTEEEQAAAFATEKIMSIKLKVKQSLPNASPYTYVYDFYRGADRKVMVSLYRMNNSGEKLGEVSDFYLSTGAFKKIANAYLSVLNAKDVDGEIPYVDEVK